MDPYCCIWKRTMHIMDTVVVNKMSVSPSVKLIFFLRMSTKAMWLHYRTINLVLYINSSQKLSGRCMFLTSMASWNNGAISSGVKSAMPQPIG